MNDDSLRAVLDAAPISLWALDKNGVYTLFEGKGLEAAGLEPGTRIGQSIFDLFPDRPDILEPVRRALAGEENRAVIRNRGLVSESHFTPLRDSEGTLNGMVAVSTVVTESVPAEAELIRVQRALRMISDCNQMLMRATDEHLLLRDVCRVIVEQGGYRFAWVGYAQRDSRKTVWPMAHAGAEDGYLEGAKITWADTARGHGPIGRAIRTGKPVAARDIANDPRFEPWREGALKCGYRCALVLPLKADGPVFGALSIFSAEPDAFDARERELLTELADDLAFGIMALRDRATREQADQLVRMANERLERDVQERTAALEQLNTELQVEVRERTRIEEALRRSELKYRIVADNTYGWEFWLDPDGTFVYVSPSCERITGYSARQFLADPYLARAIIHVEDAAAFQRYHERAMGAEITSAIEYRIVRHDGHLRWIEQASRPMFGENGQFIGVRGSNRDVTARKRMEEDMASMALFPSENPYPVMRIGLEGQLLYANSTGNELLKAEGGQGSTRKLPFFFEQARAALEIGQLREEEMTFPDGQCYSFVFAPIPAKGYVNAYGRNITKRRHTEEALRQSEERFRLALKNSPVSVATQDRDLRFTWNYNQRTVGDGSEVIGKTDTDLFEPEEAEHLIALKRRAMETGKEVHDQIWMDRNGRRVFLDLYIEPLRNETGEVTGVGVATVDLTELKTIEEELREREATLGTAQRVAHIGNWWWIPETDEGYWSEELFRIYGRDPHSGTPSYYEEEVRRSYAPHSLERLTAAVARALQDGTPWELELELFVPDGTHKWLNAWGEVERDATGRIRQLHGTVQDITERKHAEAQIRRHNEELEGIVAERTAQIQRLGRLRVEAEKQAAIGRMAARIAHEINNPLAGIKNSFLLVKKVIPTDYKHYEFVIRMDKELDRIARIVRQMFEIYKPERSAMTAVNVPGVLKDVAALLEGNARQNEVTIMVDPPGTAVPVLLHEDSLRQALFALIQNAIEASSAGKKVHVSASVTDQALEISIADQGCGIPPEAGTRIFEPFFTTKSDLVSGGLGLGLSITKGVVESMGGVLSYESDVGKGTTFRLILPVSQNQ